MKRQTTNIHLMKLISELRKSDALIWKRISRDLQKSRRTRRSVNLSRINRYSNEGDVIVVPGKVLGEGNLNKKIEIAAFDFSESSKEKIKSSGSSLMEIQELLKKNPSGKGVKIIG